MSDATLIGSGQLGRGLSLFGSAALSWSIIAQFMHGHTLLWVLVAALAANVTWMLFVSLGSRVRAFAWVCVAIMITCGGLTAAGVNGSSLVAAGFAVLWVTRDIRLSARAGLVLAAVTCLLVVVGDVLAPVSLLGLVALEGGVVVAFLAGLSRRQFLLSEVRSRQLLEEHARADVLAARTQLASEIHDVLAHSLGGLVIQLDAADALLESGDSAAAAAKVHDARALAAEGLSEARRAVAALSEPPSEKPVRVPAEQLVADVSALIRAHSSLGGHAELRQVGHGLDIPTPVLLAMRRAVQEGLTNARRHAPTASVEVMLTWTAGSVELRITNPQGTPLPSPGGGHGLVGMRDRFARLPGGSATAAASDGNFVVSAKASTV